MVQVLLEIQASAQPRLNFFVGIGRPRDSMT